MTEIQGNCLATDEPEVFMLFWGDYFQYDGMTDNGVCSRIQGNLAPGSIGEIMEDYDERERCPEPPLLYFTKPQVREALKPGEGKSFFAYSSFMRDEECPEYRLNFGSVNGKGFQCHAVNDLSIGKTCGEIRKLIEWSKT